MWHRQKIMGNSVPQGGTEAYENERQSSQQAKRATVKARTITAERSTESPACKPPVCIRLWPEILHGGTQNARLDFINHDSWPYIHAYVLYFGTCTCSVQLSMFHMERHSRNKTFIIIIIRCVEYGRGNNMHLCLLIVVKPNHTQC